MNSTIKARSVSMAYSSSSQAQASTSGARPPVRIKPMFTRLPLKTAFGAAVLAAAGIMLTPAAASAQVHSYQGAPQNYGGYSSQSYGYGQQSGYGYGQQPDYRGDRSYGQSYDRSGQDYCRSERRNRQGTGAAVGATFGAVLGSQLGARGRRTEGSVLGAVIGGALGAAVGGDSARDCNSSGHVQYGYGDSRYSDARYSDSGRYRFDDRGYSSQTNVGYQNRYDDRGYGDDRGYQYQSNDGYRSDCRPVPVQSRDQYGRTVTRYQQSC
jgi:uncharacterized protein YcfJ